MRQQMNKTEILKLRVTPDFKSSVETLAENEGLSLSAYITRLLKLQINEQVDTRRIPQKVEGKE